MKPPIKRLFPLVLLLPLSSCEGKINLFDQSFGLVYEKEGHYWLNGGQKSGFSSHAFDKLVPAYEKTKTMGHDYVVHYYDYACRCGYKMSYDRLSFVEKEDGAAIVGYKSMTTGYDINGHTVTQERTIDELYEIPSKYAGKDVVCVEENAFYAENETGTTAPSTEATLPSTIQTIKTHAFYQTAVSFKSEQSFPNLVNIEEQAFEESNFTAITIGDKLESIGEGAFEKSKLKKIDLGSSNIKEIPYLSFYQCASLKEIVLPHSLETIGNSAFYGCKYLTEVTLPDGLTSVEWEAFEGCSNLEKLIVPTSVSELTFLSFAYSYSDKSVHIPKILYKGSKGEGDFDYKLQDYVYYYSEQAPTEKGQYWHYVDGEPIIYK